MYDVDMCELDYAFIEKQKKNYYLYIIGGNNNGISKLKKDV